MPRFGVGSAVLLYAKPEWSRLAHGALVCGVLATEHIGALVAILLFSTALVAGARLRPGAWTTTGAGALALVLVGAEVGWWIYLVTKRSTGSELATAFPLQLCDAAIFVAALALLFRQQLLVEMTYFWALAGSLQALITPDLPQHFPSFPFFQYYVAHGGIVAAALFLVVGLASGRGAAQLSEWPGSRLVMCCWSARLTQPPAPITCTCAASHPRRACSISWGHGRGTSPRQRCSGWRCWRSSTRRFASCVFVTRREPRAAGAGAEGRT